MSGATDREVDLISAAHEIGFRKGVSAEREKLVGLIKTAKQVRASAHAYENSNDCGEIHYTDKMFGPVALLIQALNEYEATNG